MNFFTTNKKTSTDR